jgi:hypothetical protein
MLWIADQKLAPLSKGTLPPEVPLLRVATVPSPRPAERSAGWLV